MGHHKSAKSSRFNHYKNATEIGKTQELEKLKRLPAGFYKSGTEDHR